MVFSRWKLSIRGTQKLQWELSELLTNFAFWHAYALDLCKHTEYSSEDAEMCIPANLLQCAVDAKQENLEQLEVGGLQYFPS